jgi:hypothetical protein
MSAPTVLIISFWQRVSAPSTSSSAQKLPFALRQTYARGGEVAVRLRLRSSVRPISSSAPPVTEVIAQINPILRGWVQYFAVGHSSRCFSYIRDWVEKKIRYHLARASQRHGFGWKRWSKAWLYGTLGLFYAYRVAH